MPIADTFLRVLLLGLASWTLIRFWFLLPFNRARRTRAGSPEPVSSLQYAPRSSRPPFLTGMLKFVSCRVCASYQVPFWLSLAFDHQARDWMQALAVVAIVQLLEESYPEFVDTVVLSPPPPNQEQSS